MGSQAFLDRWSLATILYSALLCLILVIAGFSRVSANAEGDALNALKSNLADPNNVLQSWDPTLVNPCTWFHVTCNSDNSVTRVELGNADLSGQLVPQLGQLTNLQYLELFSNNISGKIPPELGNLTNLVSLKLYLNNLSGPIPDTLGYLRRLRCLRLNNNTLSGRIPMSLTNIATLKVLDLSSNCLTGKIPVNGSFSHFTPIRFCTINFAINVVDALIHHSVLLTDDFSLSVLPIITWIHFLYLPHLHVNRHPDTDGVDKELPEVVISEEDGAIVCRSSRVKKGPPWHKEYELE